MCTSIVLPQTHRMRDWESANKFASSLKAGMANDSFAVLLCASMKRLWHISSAVVHNTHQIHAFGTVFRWGVVLHEYRHWRVDNCCLLSGCLVQFEIRRVCSVSIVSLHDMHHSWIQHTLECPRHQYVTHERAPVDAGGGLRSAVDVQQL